MMYLKETEKERREKGKEEKGRREVERDSSIRQRRTEGKYASPGTTPKKDAREDVRGCTCAGFAWTPATPPLTIQERRRTRQSHQPLD